MYDHYQRDARKRNLAFTLDVSEFVLLTAANCFYCGVPPAQIHKRGGCNGVYTYNGIDRKDSTQGYIQGNCVAACFECNRIKRAVPFELFMAWLHRVAIHQLHKKDEA